MTDRVTGIPENIPREQHRFVAASIDRLSAEFQGAVDRDTVERVMHESLAALGEVRVKGFIPLFAERFARDRLWALAKVERRVPDDAPTVLFLCVENAGRSQMAAAWLSHLAAGKVRVMSGGSCPGGELNAHAVAAMAERGIDVGEEFPKPWTTEIARAADVIVSMGCGDACPIFPGKRYEDWEVADPATLDLEGVRAIRDDIEQRVRALLDSLGVAT